MKISPQFSLKFSVISGFSLIVLLMAVLAVVGLWRIAEANRQVEQVVSHNNVKTSLVHAMRDALRERRAIQLFPPLKDPLQQNDKYQNFNNQTTAFLAALSKFGAMPLSVAEQEIHGRIRAQADRAQPFIAQAIASALQGDAAMAHKLVEDEIAGPQQSMAGELDKLLELEKRETEVAVSDARKAFENTRLHMLLLGSFAIGLGLMIVPVVIRKANKQAQTVQQQAMYDQLTTLPNRLLFADRLRQTLLGARQEQRSFGLFVLDLRRFRAINDTFGTRIGDQVLQYMAACIQGCLNDADTLARLDGDRFAVLSTQVGDLDQAIATTQKIRQAISEPFEISGRHLELSASVGVAMFPYHGDSADELLLAASEALEVARQSKRGYRIYSEDMAHGAEDRIALLHELHQAIAANELVLHYQPKIDFKSGQVSGVEALVRWQHPVHGLMTPEQFIPMAEQIGLIKPLTAWVLNTALRQYQVWYREGFRLPISVQVTAVSIQDPEFPAQVETSLQQHEVPASKFEIEIKEAAAIAEPARAMDCIRRLHDMGIKIAIGDFGTGNTSLTYLTELLVANIKIDKSLVQNMTTNRGGSMMVRTTVKLGHTLGIKVAAKGVENQNAWDALKEFGCDTAQGYFVSRPLPPVELMDWLRTSPWALPLSSV